MQSCEPVEIYLNKKLVTNTHSLLLMVSLVLDSKSKKKSKNIQAVHQTDEEKREKKNSHKCIYNGSLAQFVTTIFINFNEHVLVTSIFCGFSRVTANNTSSFFSCVFLHFFEDTFKKVLNLKSKFSKTSKFGG